MTHAERRERRKAIAEFVRSGKSPHEAARIFGVGRRTVTDACLEHGVTPLVGHGRPNQLRILSLLFAGSRQSVIARRLSITRQKVGDVATRAAAAGIDIPRIASALKRTKA